MKLLSKISTIFTTARQFLCVVLVFFLCLQPSIASSFDIHASLEKVAKAAEEEVKTAEEKENDREGEQNKVGKYKKARKQILPPSKKISSANLINLFICFLHFAYLVPDNELLVFTANCTKAVPRYIAFCMLRL